MLQIFTHGSELLEVSALDWWNGKSCRYKSVLETHFIGTKTQDFHHGGAGSGPFAGVKLGRFIKRFRSETRKERRKIHLEKQMETLSLKWLTESTKLTSLLLVLERVKSVCKMLFLFYCYFFNIYLFQIKKNGHYYFLLPKINWQKLVKFMKIYIS